MLQANKVSRGLSHSEQEVVRTLMKLSSMMKHSIHKTSLRKDSPPVMLLPKMRSHLSLQDLETGRVPPAGSR